MHPPSLQLRLLLNLHLSLRQRHLDLLVSQLHLHHLIQQPIHLILRLNLLPTSPVLSLQVSPVSFQHLCHRQIPHHSPVLILQTLHLLFQLTHLLLNLPPTHLRILKTQHLLHPPNQLCSQLILKTPLFNLHSSQHLRPLLDRPEHHPQNGP